MPNEPGLSFLGSTAVVTRSYFHSRVVARGSADQKMRSERRSDEVLLCVQPVPYFVSIPGAPVPVAAPTAKFLSILCPSTRRCIRPTWDTSSASGPARSLEFRQGHQNTVTATSIHERPDCRSTGTDNQTPAQCPATHRSATCAGH